MKIILVRHGKTIENEQGIMQGHNQGTLSDLGINQAKEIAQKLSEEKIHQIYSSDLARSADTAKHIAKFHPETPIKLVKELRERDFGEFTGKRKEDFGFDKNKLIGDILETKEGEQIEEVIERVSKCFEEIKQNHINENVLIVGHNAINKIILSIILNKPLKKIKPQENVEANIFEL